MLAAQLDTVSLLTANTDLCYSICVRARKYNAKNYGLLHMFQSKDKGCQLNYKKILYFKKTTNIIYHHPC